MALNIRVIAPDRVVWTKEVDEMILPGATGLIGILEGHAPLITALEIGVLRVKINNVWAPIVVLGGFAVIKGNNATVLINGVENVSDLTIPEAEEQIRIATDFLATVETKKQKIEASQRVKKAAARLQAVQLVNK